MKHAVAASSLLAIAAASPQFGGGNHGPPNGDNSNGGPGGNMGGGWAGAPSCISSCFQDLAQNNDNNDWSNFCTSDALNDLNSCIDKSDCDDSDKDATYQVIAQTCANAGKSVTASPEAAVSATSGKPSFTSGVPAGPWGGRFGNGKADWTTKSNWQSWTSAHPTPTVTDAAAWSSWASTASSDWSSWASVNGISSTFAGGFPFGGPGGSAWPTAWTSNSDWASAVSSWQTQTTGAPGPFGAWGPGNGNGTNGGPRGPGGWHGGNGVGPFGQGGPGNGWGPWASQSTGSWTNGPWTSWWGGSACPPSTWSGWTSGPWGTDAPWTTWSGCEASTTASSVVTTTVTTGSSTGVQTSTQYGIQVNAASNTADADSSSSTGSASEGAGAMPTAMVGSVAGAMGVLGAALML